MSAPLQSFTVKQLKFTFILANNSLFVSTNSNTLQLAGLRASVTIRGSGLPAFPEANLTIFGMLQADMIALTALAFDPLRLNRNTVIIEANSGAGWSIVFAGQLLTAGPDYAGAPAVCFNATARMLGFESLNPATPTSYTTATPVATIVNNICAKLGYAFENNGVTTVTNGPTYYPGTLVDQLRAVVQHFGIDCYAEGNNLLAICPKGAPRKYTAWILSPTSGLVGYPVLDYNRGFINVKAQFNPAYRFGGPVTVKDSDVKPANGDWVIGTISHELQTITSGGPWFSNMLLYPPNSLPPIS